MPPLAALILFIYPQHHIHSSVNISHISIRVTYMTDSFYYKHNLFACVRRPIYSKFVSVIASTFVQNKQSKT